MPVKSGHHSKFGIEVQWKLWYIRGIFRVFLGYFPFFPRFEGRAGDNGIRSGEIRKVFSRKIREFPFKRVKVIALLCSVPNEADLLLENAAIGRVVAAGSRAIHEGVITGRQVAICVGGMGKVNAAHAATLLLSGYHPEALIVFGIGGAYAGTGAAVGDLALANEETAGDEGALTREGFRDTAYIGIPLVRNESAVLQNC